jgi:hypothetical protein
MNLCVLYVLAVGAGMILWLIIDAVVTNLPAAIIKDYGKEIQAALNRHGASLNEDGFVGRKTVAAAEIMR